MPISTPTPHPMPGPGPGPRPYPYYRPYYITVPVVTYRYANQDTIDALNGLLANCDKLHNDGRINCSPTFIAAVEKALSEQLAIARTTTNYSNQIIIRNTY